MDRIVRYDWPGNVRALMNTVERGVILCRGEYIAEEDLPISIRDAAVSASPTASQIVPAQHDSGDVPLNEVEKLTILKTLEAAEGNKSEAARRLGITRRTLYKKLKKYGET